VKPTARIGSEAPQTFLEIIAEKSVSDYRRFVFAGCVRVRRSIFLPVRVDYFLVPGVSVNLCVAVGVTW
jgi:hypothetical protein